MAKKHRPDINKESRWSRCREEVSRDSKSLWGLKLLKLHIDFDFETKTVNRKFGFMADTDRWWKRASYDKVCMMKCLDF